jgi:predicted HAD superfamily Cof-like phosphohydrolase
MCKYINAVKEFHETFNHPVNDYKNDIDVKTRQLRVKLLFEELQELATASDVLSQFVTLCTNVSKDFNLLYNLKPDGDGTVDKKEEIDALCDLQYVLSGAILALGHQENFEKAFDEVQRSNMSKMCHSEKEVEDTIKHYKEKDGTKAYAFKKGEGWLILREGDDKVLKNVYYEVAQLEQFVQI